MTDPSDYLGAVRQRVEAATEGPWTVRRGGDFQDITFDGPDGATAACWDGSRQAPPNGEWIDSPNIDFIAHARTDVPRLLAAVEAVVGIHKPEHWENDAFEYSTEGIGCSECFDDYGRMRDWPCPTVEAVTAAFSKGGEL